VAVADGKILFGGEDGWFRAIDAHEMEACWEYIWQQMRYTLYVRGITGEERYRLPVTGLSVPRQHSQS